MIFDPINAVCESNNCLLEPNQIILTYKIRIENNLEKNNILLDNLNNNLILAIEFSKSSSDIGEVFQTLHIASLKPIIEESFGSGKVLRATFYFTFEEYIKLTKLVSPEEQRKNNSLVANIYLNDLKIENLIGHFEFSDSDPSLGFNITL